MIESSFQEKLKKDIERMFPGCIAEKVEWYRQGMPDILVLYGNKWALLECKRSANAEHQPNQDYYVDILNRMSFAAFIYPENKQEVLNELSRAFRA